MIDLPPLPPPDVRFPASLDSMARHSDSAMRTYGEACARAALEAALPAIESIEREFQDDAVRDWNFGIYLRRRLQEQGFAIKDKP